MTVHRKNSSDLIDRLVHWTGFVLLIAATSLPTANTTPICYGKVDIIFVIDASYSILDQDFQQVRNFTKGLYIKVYSDLEDNLRAGVIMYASKIYEGEKQVSLAGNQSQILTLLTTFKRDLGNSKTYTGAALEKAFEMFGSQGRADAIKILVLVTNGIADDFGIAFTSAAKLRQAGIHVLAIGISGANDFTFTAQLNSIASSVNSSYSFEKITPDDELMIQKDICGKTQDSKAPPKVEKDNVKVDLYFLLDEAMLGQDLDISKQFMKEILQTFEIGQGKALASVFLYGRLTGQYFTAGSFTTEQTLFSAIDGLSLTNGNGISRNVSGVFSELQTQITGSSTSGPVIVVLFVTGSVKDSQSVRQLADGFRRASNPSVYLLVLGIGTNTAVLNSQQNIFAYDVGTAFQAANFLALSGNLASNSLIQSIRKTIYQLAMGTYVSQGVYRWSSMFDVVFMVDGSKAMSVGARYPIVRYAIKELIDEFELGPDKARVAVLLFDAVSVYNIIRFDTYNHDHDTLFDRIDNLKLIQRTDTTDNAIGLAEMRKYFIANNREPAARLGYLITLGQASNKLLAEAEARALAFQGIQLLSIGLDGGVSAEGLTSYQLFDPVDGPVLITQYIRLLSSQNLGELKADLLRYAYIARPRGRYFQPNVAFDLIVLVHDESGKIDGGASVRNFLWSLFRSYQMGVNKMLGGVITFGANVNTGAGKEIILGADSFYTSMYMKILQLDVTPTGGPNVMAALDALITMFANHGRNVTKVAMLLIQGDIKLDALTAKIQQVRDTGISLIAVGSGPETDIVDLKNIAYNSEAELAFLHPNWQMLKFTPAMDASVIALARGIFQPQGTSNILRLPTICNGRAGNRAGIVFILDASESFEDIFSAVKAFTAALASGLAMPGVDIGALAFANRVLPNQIIEIGEFQSYAEFYAHFMDKINIDPNFKLTDTSLAIKKMVQMFGNATVNYTEKVAITITDGKSVAPSDTAQEARLARAAGIKMIAIGIPVPDLSDGELDDITGGEKTGNVSHKFIFSTTDLTNSSKLQSVQSLICTLIRPGECGIGNYRNQSLQCNACPIGTYQDVNEQLYCKKCDPGNTTSAAGANSSSLCFKACNAGYYLNVATNLCEICPIGQYQPNSNRTQCLNCSGLTITKFNGSTSENDCILDKCEVPLDLVIVVDATASIEVMQFNILKAFLGNQLDRFDIGPNLNETQISVVRIGTVTTDDDVTAFLTNKTIIRKAIRDIKGFDLTTNTASAIEKARAVLDSFGRPNISKVIFVVTDGMSQNPFETRYQALLSQLKFEIVVLGVGSKYFMPELVGLASKPEYILTEGNFFNLLAMEAYTTICEAARSWEPPTVIVTPTVKCDLELDLILVMNLPDNLSNSESQLMKAQLVNFINRLEISSTKVNIGVLSFATVLNLNDLLDLSAQKGQIISKIRSQPTSGPGTATDLALLKAVDMLGSSSRPRASKALIVVAIGESDNFTNTVSAAAVVETKGIYAISVGKGTSGGILEKELDAISTTGSNATIFVSTFSDSSLPTTLETKLCLEDFRCSYPLHIAYIWWFNRSGDILDKATEFSADVSNRFPNVIASVIEVSNSTKITTLPLALVEAEKQMGAAQLYDTIHNIVIITDKLSADLGNDTSAVDANVTALKEAGVKILIVNARDDNDTGLVKYASASRNVFFGRNFSDQVAAWKIHRALCKEPCESGYKNGIDGRCGMCAVGTYRNKTNSYTCQNCSQDSTTGGTGSTSVEACTVKLKCRKPIDLIFVIDGTSSIGNNYGLLKIFFWNLVDKFTVGLRDNETRIAAVKIGEDVGTDDFTLLSKSVNDFVVRTSIVKLEGNEQQTNTAASLAKVFEIFQEEGRDQTVYPRIVLVATDGKSVNTFQTKRYSSILKLNGIVTLVISIGSGVFQSEIKALAYDENSIYPFANYQSLLESNIIHERICDAAKNYEPVIPDTGGPDLLGECKSFMDMVFVIDASLSVTQFTFLKMRLFIAQFAKRLDVGQAKIRIGIIAFSTTVHESEVFSLEEAVDQSALEKNGIQPQKWNSLGTTNTSAALARMIEMFTQKGRQNSPFVGIVITDGKSNNPSSTKIQAELAKNKGIHMVVIGFGDSIFTQEIFDIATDPASVKVLSSFDELTTEQLLDLSCSYNFTCPHEMNIIAIWDLVNFDTIRRTEIFIEGLKKSFPNSNVTNIFVDHVEEVSIAMEEGLQIHKDANKTDTRATRVLMVITDKELEAAVKGRFESKATEAKNAGILVMVLDAAANPNNVTSIASNNKLSYETDRFDMLPFNLVLQRALCTAPCESGKEPAANGTCKACVEDKYRDAEETFLCVDCPTGRSTDGATSADTLSDCLFGVCRTPADVVFVIDSSASISPVAYIWMKVFLLNTIGVMDISLDRTRVGLVPYSSDILAPLLFTLQESTHQKLVLQAVRDLRQGVLVTGTNTARAIDAAKDMLLTQGRMTGGVIHIIVVITDGISANSYKTIEEAKKAKDNLVKIFSVGVGENVFKYELENIKSDPDSILFVTDFIKLASIKNFTEIICEDSFFCGKKMDVVIFEDSITNDTTFRNRLESFKTKMNSSYNSSSVTNVSYTSMAELDTLVKNQNLSNNPQNTKLFIFVIQTDIADGAVKDSIAAELRSAGGLVVVINANKSLDNKNVISIASGLEYLFNVENFNELPAYRFIERKLCIEPCPDGEQTSPRGVCEKCPRGTYRVATDSHICTQCSGNKTTQVTGATNTNDCIPNCGPGYKTVGDVCVECPKGEYQAQSFQPDCDSCSSGYTTVETKSTTLKQCIRNCDAGEKISSSNASLCEKCGNNTYQPATAQTQCKACPVNLNSSTGSTALDDCNDACGKALDIIFLADASISLSNTEFQLMRLFIEISALRFKVSQTDTRIGLIQFSNVAATSPRLELTQSTNRNKVITLAKTLIRSSRPGTNTADALDAAVQMFGAEGRANIPQNIVVLTDGKSDNTAKTEVAASKAKKKFINIISIGLGNSYNLPELRKIATDDTAVKTFLSFYDLLNYNILPTVCTSTLFSCGENIDFFYIKHYGGNSTVEAQVTNFFAGLTKRYKTGTTINLIDANPGTESLRDDLNSFSTVSGDQENTKILIIFTNKANSEGATSAAVTAKGVVVSVVYVSDAQTDESFDPVVSNQDLLFYAQKFDASPYIDFILRSLCIVPCGNGSERNGTGLCTECKKGEYRKATESHVCLDCGSQRTTSGTGATDVSQCVACDSTQWPCQNGGCIELSQQCDGTVQCSDGSDEICNNCTKGSKWNGALCIPCEKGTFQPNDGQTRCFKCPDGSTTDGVGKVSQENCTVVCDESGKELNYPDGGCVNCTIGNYRDKDVDAICVKCGNNFTTENEMSTSKDDCVPPCDEGQFYDSNLRRCVDCPIGKHQPDKYKDKCIACKSGTTTDSVKSTSENDCEDPCPEGEELPEGGTSAADCEKCPVGKYKSSENTTCVQCDLGYTTENNGSKNSSKCLPNCDNGTYHDENLKTCQDCPLGEYQDEKYKKQCKKCVNGTTTRQGGSDKAADCIVPCPAGYVLPIQLDSGTCTPCPQGSYREDNETVATCSNCSAGETTDNEGSTSAADCKPNCQPGEKIVNGTCEDCEIGTYQILPRQTSCVACPNYTSSKAGANSPDLCIDLCPSGTELTGKNPLVCEKCKMNFYKELRVDKNCTACSANHITLSDGATSKEECVPNCESGQRFDNATQKCVPCEENTFQPEFYKYTCVKCWDKWITNGTGAKLLSECKPNCTAGSGWNYSTADCQPCDKDGYQPEPYQTECKKCAEGNYTDDVGATAETECEDQCPLGEEMGPGGMSPADCVKCKNGTYKNSTTSTCQACPEGSITLSNGSTAISQCQFPCKEGEYWNSVLKTCVACGVGTYQDLKYQEQCKNCTPQGYTTLDGNSTKAADCVPPCQTGSAWDDSLKKCEPCKIGEYQNETNRENCTTCPTGKITLGEGSDKERDCIDSNCTANKWQCDNGECIPKHKRCNNIEDDCTDGSDEAYCCEIGKYYNSMTNRCEDCSPGTYQDETAQTTCLDCLKGLYSPAGSVSYDNCTECPAGFVFIPGNSNCTACPVNTYRASGQKTAQCEKCPLNFGTEQNASTAITDCKSNCTAGQYYDSELFRCELCPVGQYQAQNNQTKCSKCPRGTTTSSTGSTDLVNNCTDICEPGETLVYDASDLPTNSCKPCPLGQYKDNASFVCKSCPTGFGTAVKGSTECLPSCKPGEFFLSKNSSVCEKCDNGTYQPNPFQGSCINCSAGKTTPIKGATTSFLCYDKCSDGYEYISNTSSCKICDKGKYREKAVDANCTSCKAGWTTEGKGAATEDDCVPDCPEGKFYSRNDSKCELCEENSYQNKSYQYKCVKCPAGTLSAKGSDELADCKDPCTTPGEELQPDGTCDKCPIGTAKVPPSTICTKCEAGFTTETNGSTKCVPDCEAGSYFDGTKCRQCAKGTYQPNKYRYKCEDCLTGSTTADLGSTNSSMCLDICGNGLELSFDGRCKECAKNYYRTKGEQLQCTACPKNFITLYEGSETIDDCKSTCGVGTGYSNVTGKCEPCKIGFYQDQTNQIGCKPCKTGEITLIAGAVLEEECVGDCDPGTYWNGTECKKCEKGKYQSEPNKNNCATCLPGYTTDNTGSKKLEDCYDKCDSGYTYNATIDKCIPCGFDKYRDRDQHNICQHCASALMTKNNTAKSEDECVSRCPKGKYWDKDRKVCVNCSIGEYQPNASALKCIPCKDGGITLNTGTILESDCKRPCLEGEEWDNTNKTCVPCSIGEYQDEKYQENCTQCQTGKSTQSTRSTKESDCEPTSCDPGEWRCLSGVGCAPGNTRCDNDSVNQCADGSDEAGCDCTAGQYYNTSTSTCKDCEEGTYQDQSGQLSCISCRVGFNTTTTKSTNKNACGEICESGEKYNTSTGDCERCPIGTFRKKGEDSPETCQKCPSPLTTETDGAGDISYCVTKCAKGEFYNDSSTNCEKCSKGYFQDEEYNQYTCTKCSPAGTTTTIEGAISQNNCTDVCGLGEALPVEGAVKADCKKCKVGYYKNGTQFLCKKCPAGFTTSSEGSDSLDDCYRICEAGEEFDSSGTGCKPCDRGYYRDIPPTNTDQSCKSCPAGNTTEFVGTKLKSLCKDLCNDGLELSSNKNSCEPCRKGEYRKQGSNETECQSCGPGQTTANAGSATKDACRRNCTAGERHNTTSDTCDECDVGTYQDLPLQDTCKPCPAPRTTTSGKGSDKNEDCIDPCKDGYQSVNDQCVECVRGTYRQQDVQVSCQSCRNNFTTLAPRAVSDADCVPICDPGTSWDENNDTCVKCENGTYNPIAYQRNCKACPADKPISAPDFLSCQGDCKPGEQWNSDRGVCNWCPPGSYGAGAGKVCQTCPAGTYSFMMAATSVDNCTEVNCTAGSYKANATAPCQECPSYQVSNLTRTGCVNCTGDLVPSADRGSCIDSDWCPAGLEPIGAPGTTCVPCSQGYYRPAGSKERCKICPKNTYTNSNQSACINCPSPQSTLTSGSSSQADCRDDWCGGGREPVGSSDTCTDCAAGNYKPENTTGPCLPCPKGQFQPDTGQTSCENCPSGKLTLANGSTSIDQCKEDWCISGGEQIRDGTTDCEPCGLGTYKPVGVVGPCILCNNLTYQDETGQTSCKPCTPDGFHTKSPGAISLSDCSADWCDPGKTINRTTGLCMDCGVGKYRGEKDVGCQTCTGQRVTYSKTATSSDECKNWCPEGSFINLDTSTCDLCKKGTYSDKKNQVSCTPCPDGLRTPKEGTSDKDLCKENWCPGGLTYDESFETCVPCGFGKYRRFKVDPLCLQCPDGWSTLTNTASSVDECINSGVDPTVDSTCTGGHIYRNGLCRPCPIGYYRKQYTANLCIECPYGFTTRIAGAWDDTLCITMSSQCERRFDLVIAVDLSNSVSHDASRYVYKYVKPWLKCLIRRLDIHPYRVRVSILKYARGVATLVDLHNGYTAEKICGLIDKRLKPSIHMNVNTASALQKAYDMFSQQGRPGVQKHVLLITDDRSDNPALAEQTAEYLKTKQVHITVVGTDVLEVSRLASSSYSTFAIADYLHLPSDYSVLRAVCRPRK